MLSEFKDKQLLAYNLFVKDIENNCVTHAYLIDENNFSDSFNFVLSFVKAILCDNNNYDKTYNVVYGMNNFPKKIYNGVVYEEGMYESLVIEIGDGLGNNYWCFLYPSLCFADYQDNDEKLVYKSKIVEIINKLF